MTDERVEAADEDRYPAVGIPERFRTEEYVIGTGGFVYEAETGETVWPPQAVDGVE